MIQYLPLSHKGSKFAGTILKQFPLSHQSSRFAGAILRPLFAAGTQVSILLPYVPLRQTLSESEP
jgi:hypothetical protein